MNLATLTLLGFSLSVDAFAAALGKGAAARGTSVLQAFRVGAYFGLFEAVAPAVGWALGIACASYIASVDHWIAFGLLAGVGGHMLLQAVRGEPEAAEEPADGTGASRHLSPMKLAVTAMATSIDATAVGVSLGLVEVNIVQACLVIGAVTTAMCFGGVLIGRTAGPLLGRKAEVLGGVALIGIGVKILIEHLSA